MGHTLDNVGHAVTGGLSNIGGALEHAASTSLVQPLRLLPQSVQNYAYPIIGSLIGGPLGAGAGSALNTYNQTGDIRRSLASGAGTAAGSYVGGNIGSTYLPNMGTVGNATGNVFGQSAGNMLAENAPQIAGSSLGRATGSLIGSRIGNDFASSLTEPPPPQPSPWTPSRQSSAAMPASLSGQAGSTAYGIGGLNQDQQLSNLASRGVFGGGISPEEQNYFVNQENRRLVDDSGNTQSLSALSPVEMTYLQRLGLGGNNSTDLLRAISQWQPA